MAKEIVQKHLDGIAGIIPTLGEETMPYEIPEADFTEVAFNAFLASAELERLIDGKAYKMAGPIEKGQPYRIILLKNTSNEERAAS